MNIHKKQILGVLTIVAAGAVSGCGNKADTQTSDAYGVETNRIAEQVRDEAVRAGEATRDASGRAMERTGEQLQEAGENMQDTGNQLQQ